MVCVVLKFRMLVLVVQVVKYVHQCFENSQSPCIFGLGLDDFDSQVQKKIVSLIANENNLFVEGVRSGQNGVLFGDVLNEQ